MEIPGSHMRWEFDSSGGRLSMGENELSFDHIHIISEESASFGSVVRR